MLGSSAARQAAAEGDRSLAMGLDRVIAEMIGDVWSGADADRVLSEWEENVTQRLLLAADKLDGIELEDLVNGGFRG